MADGNVGSLYMTLGLKDEVSAGLGKVAKSLTKSKSYTDELKREVEGLRKELKGVNGTDMSEPIKKALSFIKQYDKNVWASIETTNKLAYTLRGVFNNNNGEINIKLGSIPNAIREVSKLSKQLDSISDKNEKTAFKSQVSNALDYLRILQDISRKQAELNTLSKSSRNIDKAEIASAKNALNDMQMALVKQIFNRATNSSSLIDNNFVSEIKKLLSMSLREIGDYMRNLKKDNPLSVFVNSADMLTSKIAAANSKILEMQSLMRGSKIPNLMDTRSLDEMRGLVGAMSKLTNEKGIGQKTEKAKIDKLVSDYARLSSEMNLAMGTFRRMSREYDNASARLVSWYSKYRELQSIRDKRVSLYLDTKDVDAELARIRAIFNELNTIRSGLKSGNEGFIGMLGSRGAGVDTGIYNNVKKAANEEIAAREKIAKQAERFVENEIKAEQRRNEQRLKDIDREGKALQRNAEIQQKLKDQQERNQKKQGNEALREEYRLREAKLRQLDREGKALQKNAEIQQRFAEQQNRLNTRMSNEVVTISSKIESLTSIYRRLTSELNRSTLLGIDTSKIQAEMSRIESQILRLVNIKKGLETGDTSYLGAHRTIGTATDRSAARSVLQEYRDLNSEKEKSIKLEARHQLEIANTAAKVRNDLARAFEQVNTRASKTSDIIRDLKSLFLQGGLVFGAQQFFNSIVRTGGEIVQQHIALRSIIGDIQKADELFAQTQQLALQSPFKFGELNRDVKQLAAFGVEANDLYDTTKRLADIASGLGVSFERLGLAYGQVKARSWLDGKELRQFAYAGLPLLERITQLYNATAKNGRTNYTQSDVKKMITNREVSFEDVKTVLWNMTNEGGQFYNMQLVLSETLLGRWNKLIDAWEIMLGKFAEGNNVVGGTFKMIIDQVTSLMLALDRLSPVLVAAAAVFVGKKALGLIPMGITKELSALQTATNLELRRYAVKQQELVTEGKITQAKAAQNVMMRGYMLADKQTQMATMQKLALEGKLSLLQMQKAVREGLVTKELIQELEILGLISAKQAELIMQQGMRSTAQLAGMQAMGGIGKGASALLGVFGGPWGIAAMLGMSLWMGYSQFEDKVKESIDNLKTSAQQKFEQLNNYLNSIGAKPQDSESLKTQVDSMKEILEQSGYYTDSIKAQVENTVKLTDQYDILKKKIEEAKNASQFDVVFAGNARNAVTMSGQTSGIGNIFDTTANNILSWIGLIGTLSDSLGWSETGGVFGWLSGVFNEDIVKNSEQLAESLNKVSSLLMTMDSKKVEEVANQFLSAGDKTKSLEEKLRILKESGSWDGFVKKIIEGGILSENEIDNIGDKADDLIDDLNEIKDDDVPKIMEELARQRNMELDEFKIWAKDHPIAFGNMLDTIMKTIGDKGPKIKELLYDAFYGFMGMSKPEEPTVNNNIYRNPIKGAFANQIKQKLYSDGTITGTGRIGKYTVKQINTYLQQVDKDTYQETGEAILKNYKQWRNEVDTMDTSGADKNSAKYKRAKWMLDLWDTIRKAGNLSEDVGKNKNTGNFGKDGNNQEDEELKRLRERIDAFKAFRQMYQKAKEVMPKDKAKDWAYGLFPEMKDLNPDDYIGSIEKLKKGFNFALSPERKKALTSLNREIGDWKISELLKPEFEKAAANFKEALDKTMKQWDLWRTLMDKTGNENFANLAFTNGGIFDEQAKNLIRQFEIDYKIKFPGIYANDGDAKNALEGVAGAYERWKAIADLVKNNYVKYLQEAADIIEKTASTEEKILAINERYGRLAREAASQGNIEVATRYRIQQRKEVTSTRLEGFERSSEYTNFFGAILSLTVEQAKTAAEKIRQVTNEAFQQGAIDAREYAKRIKQINEQMQKLQQPRKSFFNGGIQGIAQQRYDDGESMFNEASNKYGEWQEKFNEALAKNDIATMEAADKQMAAAEKNAAAGEGMMSSASDMMMTIAIIDTIVHNIDGIIQGLNEAFNSVKEAADAVGVDTESDGWQDAQAWFSAASSLSSGATKAWEGLKNGDVGGIISGAIGSITGPITAFARAHDAKMDRRIQQAERNIRAINNMSNNISTILEKILGGLYSYTNNADTVKMLKDMMKNNEEGSEAYNAAQKALGSGNYFDTQYAALLAQKSEIQKQRDAEDRKKKTDQDAIAQYDQQLKELDIQIKAYAQDFLKEMYSIDFKSWASQLTDSIVEAWSKGEDAATSYHDKVQELIKDLTKNILSQKIMEMALQPTLDTLQEILKQKGKLDETDIPKIADQLIEAGNNTVENITNILDALKEQGWDLSENGTLSVSNSIKGITEDTADLLASYINQCRADLSVVRNMHERYYPQFSEIGNAQIIQMKAIAQNTLRNAEAAERIEMAVNSLDGNMKAVINGTKKFNVK